MTTSPIARAVASKSGDALVAFLLDYPYEQGESSKDTYMDVRDFDPGYTPGTLSEVQYLADTGALPEQIYLKFLTAYTDSEEQ